MHGTRELLIWLCRVLLAVAAGCVLWGLWGVAGILGLISLMVLALCVILWGIALDAARAVELLKRIAVDTREINERDAWLPVRVKLDELAREQQCRQMDESIGFTSRTPSS